MERSLADALNERAVQHWTGLGIYPTAATATRWAFFFVLFIWYLKLISFSTKKFKEEKSLLFTTSKWWLRKHFLHGANHLHWQLMISCLLHTQLLHLANCPSPPPVSIAFPLSGLRVFTCCRLCRNSRTESFSVFFPFCLGWTLQFPVWMETITDQTACGGMCHAGSSARRVTGGHVTSH